MNPQKFLSALVEPTTQKLLLSNNDPTAESPSPEIEAFMDQVSEIISMSEENQKNFRKLVIMNCDTTEQILTLAAPKGYATISIQKLFSMWMTGMVLGYKLAQSENAQSAATSEVELLRKIFEQE